MWTPTKEELAKIIENHQHWINKDCDGWGGMRANFYRANLSGADLSGANFYRANLSGTNLYGANLYEANLCGANLYEANLSGTNLSGANLCGANLYGANLYETNLSGANLCGAKNVPFIPTVCPDTGPFTGWKKGLWLSGYVIIGLDIPADAKRSSATTRKCRCSRAVVKSITSIDGSESFDMAFSKFDRRFIYKVGETVSVDNFDEDRFNECSTGIHFFINRQEAVDYKL